jgi:1-acyl-sn-glycerol-3-phosphate acyltransferase
MSGQLPLWSWRQLTPFRYFVYNRLFFTPLLHWIFLAFGCFPTKSNDRLPAGLPFAETVIKLGQTPFIFPEGKRAKQGSPARAGIAELAKLPAVEIIPVHIEWSSRGWLRRYTITIGRPFDGGAMSADEIMKLIYDLPV